jgi:hypothetical protein
MKRREFLATAAATPLVHGQGAKKRIACLSSTYHVRSHSDNFITRFLEGYWIGDKYYEPPFQVMSLWMDQVHPADIGHRLAKAILVCEHGNYPHNEKQQQLYPRYEFFEQVVKIFRDSGRSCPVFVDKHLSYDWKKAKQMYD